MSAGEARVITSSRAKRALAAVLIGLCAVFCVVTLATHGAPSFKAFFAGVLLPLIVAFAIFRLWFGTWRVDEVAIEGRTVFGQPLRIRWTEMVAVTLSGDRVLVLRGRSAYTANIGDLEGVEEVYRLVLERAPAESMTPRVRFTLEERLGRIAPPATLPVDAPEPQRSDPQGEARARWQDNPFFVLGLSPECSRAEVERAGQKLLALLAIDSASAKRFASPLGEGERTPDRVRAAMAELRDPERRIVHEAWAQHIAPPEPAVAEADLQGGRAEGWGGAMAATGWRAR